MKSGFDGENMLKLFKMVFFVDDGYSRFSETKLCFANNAETAISLAMKKFDQLDLVKLDSVNEVEIYEGLFV